VEVLQAWLTAAEIGAGPVFRPVGRGARGGTTPLGDDGFVRALKRRAAAAGLDPDGFVGHSLRAGFLTSAAEAGADVLKMAEVSRHRSMDVLRRYAPRGSCEACRQQARTPPARARPETAFCGWRNALHA
jgi:integrase